MKTIGLVVFVAASLIIPRAVAHATCQPGTCCVEAGCCSAWRICQTGQGCSCTWSCGQGQSSCSCTCLPDGPETMPGLANVVARKDASPVFAIPIDTPSGLTASADMNLETATALLQNMSRWTVTAEAAVKARVAHGTWEGRFQDIVEMIAASYGVKAEIDEKTRRVTLH